MQLDAILEIAVGLILTWLILSIATSQIQEVIVDMVGWRARFLESRIQEMLKNPDLMKQFYGHPLIQSLYTKSGNGKVQKPVAIPNPVFAKAAVDIFLNAGKDGDETPAGAMSLQTMRTSMKESLSKLQGMDDTKSLARTLKHLAPKLDEEVKDLDKKLAEYRANVENWFDTTMIQATALYRKSAYRIALVIGLFLAIFFNVDSLAIVNNLWRDPTLRQAIVAQAGNISSEQSKSFDATLAQLNDLSLPIGWNEKTIPGNGQEWATKVLGILLSAAAAAQGSPFWFDILKKLVSGRSQSSQQSKSG